MDLQGLNKHKVYKQFSIYLIRVLAGVGEYMYVCVAHNQQEWLKCSKYPT